jgi:dTDP-4-amino-4,6-dideoxy-D-galactose acyltransferase
MSKKNLCQFLEWDTRFFGLKIARVVPHRLHPLTLQAIKDWCAVENIECLYFLADSDDPETVRLAQMGGFDLVDIRVTLEKHVAPGYRTSEGLDQVRIRPSDSGDVPILKGIARASFRASRFYFDPHFPPERCDALFETWIERSCLGYADMVLVAERQASTAGFITCHLERNSGEIGLVGVSPDARGKGMGKLLVNAALKWFVNNHVHQVSVVTQGRNTDAQRLYQRCGFLTNQVQLWYHWWPKKEIDLR